jgi:hypothetical protein
VRKLIAHRLDVEQMIRAKFAAELEKVRTKEVWDQSKVVRAWLELGEKEWNDGKRP